MKIQGLIVLVLICIGNVHGQKSVSEIYFEQDSIVWLYLEAGESDKLLDATLRQVDLLNENDMTDSIYKYTYHYGRAISATESPEISIEKTQIYLDNVLAIDDNKSHQLFAISEFSWTCMEAGNDSICFVNDQRYYDLVQTYPEASIEERYMSHYSMGFNYENQGKSEEAIYHFTECLKPAKTDSLNHLNHIMDGYNGLGVAYWRNGNLTEAKAAFYESIRYSQFDKDTLNAYMYQANAYGNMSLVYEDEGNLVKSKELLEMDLRIRQAAIEAQKDIFQREQQRRHLIGTYHNLAALYLQLGDLERSRKAEAYCQQLRVEFLPEGHPDHAKSLDAFGSLAFAEGDFSLALNLYQESLEKMTAGMGIRSPYVTTAHQQLSKAYNALGQYEKAIEHIDQAIDNIREISNPATNQELAMAYYYRSTPEIAMGNWNQAESDLKKAMHIFEKTRDSKNYMFGLIYLELASIKESESKFDSSEYYIDKAISLGQHESTESTKYDHHIKFLPSAYGAKSLIISRTGNRNSERSLEFALKGRDILIKSRGEYFEDFSQLTLFDDQQSIFDISMNASYDLYAEDASQKYIQIMLQLAEESKSILLRNQLNKFTSLRVNDVPDSLISSENEYLNIISGKIEVETPDEVLDAEKKYEALLDYYESKYPDYYALRYAEKVASIEQIKNDLLSEGQNLLEYVLTEDRAYVILINSEKAIMKSLDLENLRDDIDTYNTLITGQSAHLRKVSENLYAQLFAPIEKDLNGTEIILVPDGDLFNINFETLARPNASQIPEYLIYDFTFSYLLSSTTALQFKELSKKQTDGVLAIAPGYTDEMKTEYLAQLSDSTFIDQQYLSSIQQPFSVNTAQTVSQMFSGSALVAQEATEQNFKDLAEEHAIIHLSTHTEINNLSPLLSKFILSKQYGDSTNQDGYLHAYEIYNLSLRAELAVLTACETGLGKETSSEGVLSIAHSFAYAGCPSIVMSIWQIDEKTSTEIVESFYKYLRVGEPKNTALRQAKLDYLEDHDGELLHPYYWSGLVLVGNTDKIHATSQFPWRLLLLVLVIAIFAGIMAKRKSRNLD